MSTLNGNLVRMVSGPIGRVLGGSKFGLECLRE